MMICSWALRDPRSIDSSQSSTLCWQIDLPLKGIVFLSMFYIFFSGFAIDRSKKYLKTIEIDRKIDAVDPQAAADNPPPPPSNNG